MSSKADFCLFLFLAMLSYIHSQQTSYSLPIQMCSIMFGKFCIRCIMSTCLQCKTDNFTLTSYNSTHACTCQDPYLFNLEVANRTNITTQAQFISQTLPCILCTDKFSLEACSPALFTKTSTKYLNRTKISLGFNRDITVLERFLSMETLNKSLQLRIQKDNAQIKIDYIEIQLPINWIGGSFAYSITLNVENLEERVLNHYIQSQYKIDPYFVVKVGLRKPVLVNGTGLPLPQSFQTCLGFRSRRGFEQDQQYKFLYNGSQWLRFYFSMPPYNSTPVIEQNNSTQNEIDALNIEDNKDNKIFSNNLQIYHIFKDDEKKIKVLVQFGLFIGNSIGLVGSYSTSWIVLSIGFTQIFMYEGFYSNQTNRNSSSPANRLLLFEDLPNMTFQFSNLELLDCIHDISNLTLLLNPLVLVEPYSHEVYLMPNFTIPFVLTIASLLITLFFLVIIICYVNRYVICKKHYGHSHLLKTLSDNKIIVRSLYLSLRCLYPIFFYVASIFVKQGIVENLDTIKKINLDVFHYIYLGQIAFMGIVIVGLPFFAIFYFSSIEKDNLYIFWRLYGEKSKQKENSKNQPQSSKDSQESSESSEKDSANENSSIKQLNNKNAASNQCMQGPSKQTKNIQMEKMKPSIKPKIYLIFDYFFIISYISICVWIKGSVNLRNNLLIAVNSFFLVLSFYMYVTVGVSKIFAVIKIVDVSLNLIPVVCKLFWSQNIIAAKVGYYSMIGIVLWSLVSILFSFFSMLYWEVQGLGVSAFFLQKIVPILQDEIELKEVCLSMNKQTKQEEGSSNMCIVEKIQGTQSQKTILDIHPGKGKNK